MAIPPLIEPLDMLILQDRKSFNSFDCAGWTQSFGMALLGGRWEGNIK